MPKSEFVLGEIGISFIEINFSLGTSLFTKMSQ